MSVRFTVRLPEELHARLEGEAAAATRSLHGEVLHRLWLSLGSDALAEPAVGLIRDSGEVVGAVGRVLSGSSAARPAGACSFDTPRGVRCKACGDVHR